jgi:hypothetical protein
VAFGGEAADAFYAHASSIGVTIGEWAKVTWPPVDLGASAPAAPVFEEAVEILPELEPPKVPVLPVLTKLPVLLFEENEPVFTAYAGTAEITVKTAMSETTNVFIIFFFILIFLGLVIFIYFLFLISTDL